MVMGRKTWESMGSRPLPNRRSVVLTADHAYKAEGAEIVHSVEEAMEFAKAEELMVIGGAGVFQHFLPLADRLLVTQIDEDVEGDVFFPHFDWSEFELVLEKEGIRDEKNPYAYRFLTYERHKTAAQ